MTMCPALADIESVPIPASTARTRRVLYLLSLVIVLSLLDLYLTLLFATYGSFAEANPLARAIMQSQSIGLIVAWKLGSVLTTVGILYTVRRARSAELGAWVCLAVLGWLTFQWTAYLDAPPITADALEVYGYNDGHWVSLAETD
jgi:hypothetical protein